jgi:hypothetical protein
MPQRHPDMVCLRVNVLTPDGVNFNRKGIILAAGTWRSNLINSETISGPYTVDRP